MSLITRMCRQTAVLWKQADPKAADEFGKALPGAAPREVKCRWEDKQAEFTSFEGTTLTSSAVVYVLEDLHAGDVLMLGTLQGVTNPADSKSNSGAREVKGFSSIPDRKAKKFLRTAYLV